MRAECDSTGMRAIACSVSGIEIAAHYRNLRFPAEVCSITHIKSVELAGFFDHRGAFLSPRTAPNSWKPLERPFVIMSAVMIGFDSPHWLEMKGGCKAPFDPRPVLSRLEAGESDEDTWHELWDELHHQGCRR
jgi:hypothetical protein